jgi:hypothetical protein
MRIRPVTALGMAGLAVIAAGCLGSAAPKTTPSTTTPTSPSVQAPATQVMIRSSVGGFTRSGGAVRTRCPARATCTPALVRGASPRAWVLEVSRTLTCNPAGGGYRNPAAACRALRDFARRYARGSSSACACPLQIGIPGIAVGDLNGRAVKLPIDFCTACGLGSHAGADVRTLLAG